MRFDWCLLYYIIEIFWFWLLSIHKSKTKKKLCLLICFYGTYVRTQQCLLSIFIGIICPNNFSVFKQCNEMKKRREWERKYQINDHYNSITSSPSVCKLLKGCVIWCFDCVFCFVLFYVFVLCGSVQDWEIKRSFTHRKKNVDQSTNLLIDYSFENYGV